MGEPHVPSPQREEEETWLEGWNRQVSQSVLLKWGWVAVLVIALLRYWQ